MSPLGGCHQQSLNPGFASRKPLVFKYPKYWGEVKKQTACDKLSSCLKKAALLSVIIQMKGMLVFVTIKRSRELLINVINKYNLPIFN